MRFPLSVVLAGGLAAVHLFSGRLRFLQVLPRSRYLSLSGGVAVAYVFGHLLPEITHRQSRLSEDVDPTAGPFVATDEEILFLVVLAGFAAFYGLEWAAARSRQQVDTRGDREDDPTRPVTRTFWLHVGSFALYNVLVGYLLATREEAGLSGLLLYFVAMALHFVVNDYALRDRHQEAYTEYGRWFLACAVLVGVLIGLTVVVPEEVLSVFLAFLAGGIILNVIKEELPEHRESDFWAFAAGAGGYTVLLVLY